GKHSVEMGGDHELRLAGAALAERDHVALGVDRSVLETELLKSLQVVIGPHLFLEGRRRNFRDPLLLLEGARVIRFDVVQRLGHLGICQDRLMGGVDRRGRWRALRPRASDERQQEQKCKGRERRGGGSCHGTPKLLDATSYLARTDNAAA